jgi:hypothetical protein
VKVLRQRKKRSPYTFTTGRPNTFSIPLLQTTLPAPNPSQIWIEEQFGEREVEPNRALGQALRYVLRHWEGLMKFLTVAGAH